MRHGTNERELKTHRVVHNPRQVVPGHLERLLETGLAHVNKRDDSEPVPINRREFFEISNGIW